MRSSFDARSMRFSMSRIDSKYSLSLTLSPLLIFGLRLCESCRTSSRMLRSSVRPVPSPTRRSNARDGIDLLGRRLGRRDPRQARAVDHRQAVFEPQLVRLDAEHEARDRRAAADLRRDDLIHRRADADLVRIEADRRTRQHVHASEVRAGRHGRRLVVEPLDEDHVLAVRHHRQRGRAQLHGRAAALGPPVDRLDAVREEDDPQPSGGVFALTAAAV